MRHATRSQRLSLPGDQRQALLHGMVKSLVLHGQIRTTLSRAREAQRLADRLVTLGKDGSIHSRRKAFRVLQDRTLVKRLFADIAPRFTGISGGYTRVARLSLRQGDGAERVLLAFSRLPAIQPARPPAAPKGAPPAPTGAPRPSKPREQEAQEKPKGLFEGLRKIWTRKKKGSAAA
jgi:large subunit ribosomal protein L17